MDIQDRSIISLKRDLEKSKKNIIRQIDIVNATTKQGEHYFKIAQSYRKAKMKMYNLKLKIKRLEEAIKSK